MTSTAAGEGGERRCGIELNGVLVQDGPKTLTLVVVGSHDVICPLEEAEDISRGIPNSNLVVFDHSGHNPAADEPKKFQKVVLGFLEKL
ncbi:AB hydrolase-1 domain-containing protein [Fusarium sp. Ph1]|nr:AB hydrolase-1 domain-containing protein [Fusarium sp. Ph1]